MVLVQERELESLDPTALKPIHKFKSKHWIDFLNFKIFNVLIFNKGRLDLHAEVDFKLIPFVDKLLSDFYFVFCFKLLKLNFKIKMGFGEDQGFLLLD